MSDADRLRRDSLWLSRLTLFLLAATALVTVLPVAIGVGLAPMRGLPPALAWAALAWLPVPFYLYALWAIGAVFRAVAAESTFGPAIASGCKRAGWALALGGALSAVGVPNLMWLAYGRGGPLQFDVAYLAVGVVGLALVLLGRLLARAAALEDELGGFF